MLTHVCSFYHSRCCVNAVNALPVLLSHWMKMCNAIPHAEASACSIIQLVQWIFNREDESRKQRQIAFKVKVFLEQQHQLHQQYSAFQKVTPTHILWWVKWLCIEWNTYLSVLALGTAVAVTQSTYPSTWLSVFEASWEICDTCLGWRDM